MSSPSIFRRRLRRSVSQSRLTDSVYNWILFFRDHAHCTKFAGTIAAFANIYASVIQGSVIGPASYIIPAADFQILTRY